MLREDLRSATQHIHQEVEALSQLGSFNYARYLHFLLANAHVYLPLEQQQLSSDAYLRLVPDAHTRARGSALRADLRAMGASWHEPAPPTHELPELVGASYVFEGATLGARVLLKRWGSVSVPHAFLNAYDSATGPMWNRFSEALTRAPFSLEERRRACESAVSTFRNLGVHLRSAARDGRVTRLGVQR